MSEALDKVRGISQLPIFPLPLVMLPNELLPLHIFEDRYKVMLKDIGRSRNMFGISLFETDNAVSDRPDTSVGCVAEIRETESLPDGRSNILVLGIVRYRLADYTHTDTPYHVAEVNFFEDEPEKSDVIGPIADEVFLMFERMAKAAFRLSGSRGTLPEIQRTDPETMSFMITAAFNFENELKYRMIEMTSTTKRLNKLKELLALTVTRMEGQAKIYSVAQTNGHSEQKPDI